MKEFFDKDDLRLMTAEECAGHTIDYAYGWKACIDWIKSAPAANVVPVPDNVAEMKENNMNDFISRQWLVECVNDGSIEFDTQKDENIFIHLVRDIAPSAQQEQSTKIQEILEYLDTTLHPIVSPDNWNVYAELHDMVSSLSSAQPERKTGRWIPVDCYSACGGDEVTWMAHGNPTAFYYCSECNEQCYAGEDGESLLTSFCPCCGAKMEGGTE